jgi:hypothetical protein
MFGQVSDCGFRLMKSEFRLIPPEAVNSTIEESRTQAWRDRYITHEFTVSAMKAIWEDFKAEPRGATNGSICLAEWVALVQGTQASTLIEAGIPVEPDKARAQIVNAMSLCTSRRGKLTDCPKPEIWRDALRQVEANYIVLGFVPSSGLPVLRFTNRSKATTIYNIRLPLFVEDKENNLHLKRGEFVVPQLPPGKLVTVTLTELPEWEKPATAYYNSNWVTGQLVGVPGDVSYRLGASRTSSYPLELFSGK